MHISETGKCSNETLERNEGRKNIWRRTIRNEKEEKEIKREREERDDVYVTENFWQWNSYGISRGRFGCNDNNSILENKPKKH